MCVVCAMTAATAATGFRSWMQNHHLGWLTPRRMRGLTVAAMCAAALVSSLGLSGSTPAGHAPVHATHPARR
jgi:hypothetical protein